MTKEIDTYFDFSADGRGVFQLFPKIFDDNRGWFTEVLRLDLDLIDIKQINRSCSRPGVVRGCHAQRGPYCQAKLVEAINTNIVDVITDARPDSKTFGKSKMYLLDSDKQNMLYVPRGFLHAFIVPTNTQSMAYFNYYCDNRYDKASEICVNPRDVVLPLLENIDWNDVKESQKFISLKPEDMDSTDALNGYVLSEKDLAGKPLNEFLTEVKIEFETTGKKWYE